MGTVVSPHQVRIRLVTTPESRDDRITRVQRQDERDVRERELRIEHILGWGRHLKGARQMSRDVWLAHLKVNDMSERQARRCIKIERLWAYMVKAPRSELLGKVPVDDIKCAALADVTEAQLRGVLQRMDCDKASRKDVAAEVRRVRFPEKLPSVDEAEPFLKFAKPAE